MAEIGGDLDVQLAVVLETEGGEGGLKTVWAMSALPSGTTEKDWPGKGLEVSRTAETRLYSLTRETAPLCRSYFRILLLVLK